MFFIPLKVVSKLLSYRFAWFTILIICVNIYFFIFYNMQIYPGMDVKNLLFNPVDLDTDKYFTIFTAMFAHASLGHLASNMYFFWLFGNRLEKMIGHWRFLSIYFIAGVVGTLLFAITVPNKNMGLLGASGAIFGVIGAYVVMLPKDDIKFFSWILVRYFITLVPAWMVIGYYSIINLISTADYLRGVHYGNTAYISHVSGLISGILVGLIFILLARGKNNIFGKVVFINVGTDSRNFLENAFFKKKWNVVSLSAIEEFFVYLERFPINAIVVDYNLVSVVGEEFFSGIVEDAKRDAVPVVVLANHQSYRFWVEVHRGKQYQYVSGKNVSQNEIVQHVISLCNGGLMINDGPAPGSDEAMLNDIQSVNLASNIV